MTNAGIRLHPPLLVAVAALVAVGLEQVLPLRFAGWSAPGIVLVAAGFVLDVWAARAMRRADTGIATWSQARAVAQAGPYRFSRNPIYVGLIAAMAGVALWAGSGWGLLATAATAAAIATAVVPKEEAYLRRSFGATYEAYAARVRRWL